MMNTIRARFALMVAIAAAAWGMPAISQTPEDIGRQIEVESRERSEGFGNFTANQNMVLRNRQGQESRRQLRIKVLEMEDDGDRSLFVFDQPRDVAGTAFLVHSHTDADDDQWLYLPALQRVKRIASSNRSGSFMGSEFAYEDMGVPEVEKFTYRYLRDEACAELECTVIERFPVDERSGYSRQVVWRDKNELRIHKVEYYDRKDTHMKTLEFDDYRQYQDKFWQAHTLDMVNHVTGKSTTLTWSDFVYGGAVSPNEFTQTGLRRIR